MEYNIGPELQHALEKLTKTNNALDEILELAGIDAKGVVGFGELLGMRCSRRCF